jgi:hypothetical protein
VQSFSSGTTTTLLCHGGDTASSEPVFDVLFCIMGRAPDHGEARPNSELTPSRDGAHMTVELFGEFLLGQEAFQNLRLWHLVSGGFRQDAPTRRNVNPGQDVIIQQFQWLSDISGSKKF